MLDAAHAVRDLGEVAKPQLLLVLHAERTVVRRDDLQVVVAQAAPQVIVVVLGPERVVRRLRAAVAVVG